MVHVEGRREGGLGTFFAVLVALFLLRILAANLALPLAAAGLASLLATFVFVAAPILALFSAARFPWTARSALVFLVIGVALHAGGYLVAERVLGGRGIGAVILLSLGQAGLMLWCLGLGALVSQKISDKNLLLPISIFLAGFDAFLVFAPTGPTKVLVEQRPEVFEAVAMQVPRIPTPETATGAVQALAYVGPADLFFLAMFFVALFRFDMRTRTTFLAILPVLFAYLLVVLFLGHVRLGPVSLAMLPALVPIGLTILIVNWREFRMTAQEKALTAVVGLLAVGLAAAGFILAARQKQAQPAAPSPKVGVPVEQARPDSNAPDDRDLR